MSLPICNPLADDALKREVDPLNIVHAKRDAISIPEIVIGKVAVQVLLRAMLIDLLHTALED